MGIKVNVGSGQYPLTGWKNIDSDSNALADIYASVPPMPFDPGEVDEVYAGHFLEHLEHDEAMVFVDECHRVLKPGGRLGVVVPDFHEVVVRYLVDNKPARMEYPIGVWNDCKDLDVICKLFLYSTVQPSRHKWMYDRANLSRLLTQHGFAVLAEIDRWNDPRIPVGAWYQFGMDAIKI